MWRNESDPDGRKRWTIDSRCAAGGTLFTNGIISGRLSHAAGTVIHVTARMARAAPTHMAVTLGSTNPGPCGDRI